MNDIREKWLKLLGRPEKYAFNNSLKLLKTYDLDGYYAELYEQANGTGTVQRLMMAFPKNAAELADILKVSALLDTFSVVSDGFVVPLSPPL